MKNKKFYLDRALKWVSTKPTSVVKSIAEGFENPRTFTSKIRDLSIKPDISFKTYRGNLHYADIALKSEEPSKLATRWKLLSVMASANKGRLHLLVPSGHKSFVNKLIDKHNINAFVLSI